MNIDILLNTCDNWDAHKKRDLIEDVCEFISKESLSIQKMVKETAQNSNIRDFLDQNNEDLGRLFRISFPYHGSQEFKIKISPIVSEDFINFASQAIKERNKLSDDKINNNLIVKFIDWCIPKLVDEDQVKQISDEILAKADKDRQEALQGIWDFELLKPVLYTLIPWLKNNYSIEHVVVNHQDKSTNLSVEGIISDSEKIIPIYNKVKSFSPNK